MTAGSRPGRSALVVVMLAAVAGVGLSAWLTYMHVRVHLDPHYVSVCALGEKVNCETVAASPFSVFLGLPVSIWGIVAYGLVAVAAGLSARRRGGARVPGLLFVAGAAMLAGSLALAYISTFVIGAICIFCTATYAASAVIAVAAFLAARRSGGVVRAVREELAAVGSNRWLLVYAGLGLVALIAAGPVGFFPRYWELASWREGPVLPHGFDEEGFPWLGAERPKLVVHEYFDYLCPHCRSSHRKLRRILSDHRDELRIVRHDIGRMTCVPNDAVQRMSRCSLVRAAWCAGRGGKFWAFNDAAFARPKTSFAGGGKEYELDLAAKLGFDRAEFDECLYSTEAIEEAQKRYMDSRNRGIKDTPMYVVDGEKMDLGQLFDLISARL